MLLHFDALKVSVKCEGVYEYRYDKTECYCENATKNCKDETEHPEEKFDGKKPKNTVEVKSEDDTGHPYEAPAKNFREHLANKVVVENKAGGEGKSTYGDSNPCSDIVGAYTNDDTNESSNAPPYK